MQDIPIHREATMEAGKVKCIRLVSIFLVTGLLFGAILLRILFQSPLANTVIVLLTVVLLCCLVEMCWKPLLVFKCPSEAIETSDEDGFPPAEPSTPLVYAEAPPSYNQVVEQERRLSALLLAIRNERNLREHDLDCMGKDELEGQRADLDTLGGLPASYFEANEIQLSVDGLPTYQEAVAAMQNGAGSPQDDSGTPDAYSMLFI